MPNNESIHDRITQLVNEFGGGKNTTFASIIGSSEANVRGYRGTVMPKYDFLEKIARSFDINLKWLLTGEGSMLHDSQTPEEKKASTSPISLTEESVLYKMYKEKDEENKELLKEIGRLEERIRQQENSQNDEKSIDKNSSTSCKPKIDVASSVIAPLK